VNEVDRAEGGLTVGDTTVLTGRYRADRTQLIWVDVAGQQHSAALRPAPGPPN
jgi:hypothetical protein